MTTERPAMRLRVEEALASIPRQDEHPRYTLYRLAAAYGVVRFGRLHPETKPPWRGMLIPLSPSTHVIYTRGTQSLNGQMTIAHEMGHILFKPQIEAALRERKYPLQVLMAAEERLCEGFARCLVATLRERWVSHWKGGPDDH